MKRDKNLYAEYLTFTKTADSIFKLFINSEIFFSPLLNIVKPIPEILKKKHRVIHTVASPRYLIFALMIIPRIVLLLVIPVIHHLYHLRALHRFNSMKLSSTNFIFLSHYIGQNLTNSKDLYFGNLSKVDENETNHNMTLYIDHTKKKWHEKSFYSQLVQQNDLRLVLPKTVNTKDLLIIYKNNFKNFIDTMFVIVANKGLQKKEIILIMELALQQFGMETFAQTALLNNLVRILRKTAAKNIVLTFEGHSYESYLAKRLLEEFSGLKIAVYQFAPVVPSQIIFFRNLDQLSKNIRIYVSGPQVKSIILERTQVSPNRISVLGSRKNPVNYDKFSSKKLITFLLAAEDSENALSEFIDLGFTCALENPKIVFVVRAHPASNIYKAKLFMKIKKPLPNLILSENSLEHDMRQASYCIYRSSSVGLEGLAFGVVPIHFTSGQNFGLDPIELIDLPHRQFDKSSTLRQEILNISKNHELIDEKLFNTYQNVFHKYFSPLDFHALKA